MGLLCSGGFVGVKSCEVDVVVVLPPLLGSSFGIGWMGVSGGVGVWLFCPPLGFRWLLASALLGGSLRRWPPVVPGLGWEWQLLIFGVLSVVLTVAYKKYFKGFNEETDSPLLNDRAAQMAGDTFVLDNAVHRAGSVMIHDTRWQVECAGVLAAGVRVKVVGSRGMTLLIEPE